MLQNSFFEINTTQVAKELLGKVIYSKYQNVWLKVLIIETEAYLMSEKASHGSLGFTKKREAIFMNPGTIYMYYSRGKDSLNISTGEEGDAVLVKAGVPYLDEEFDDTMVTLMKKLNPINDRERETNKLCSGQTLLAQSLNLKVKDWDKKQFDKDRFFVKDVGYNPDKIIETTRLGIPKGRDEHLFYRFVDYKYKELCTKNPISKNTFIHQDYNLVKLD
jgi:DNA-3-methyladenine glycosylase